MTARLILKRTIQAVALLMVSPMALVSSFGKIGALQELFAQSLAVVPGFPGVFLRSAYYRLTLENCSIDVVIGFGSFFSRRRVVVQSNVSIGSYCVIGQAHIGARTQIASHVEIPGKGQHSRDATGRLSGPVDAPEAAVSIGSDCWIGASAIVMANIGDASTIGAGSVVVKEIPRSVIAVGSPAKPIRPSLEVEAS
jgi:acetyltransferase-like isoleucine patch superfamily enzyme